MGNTDSKYDLSLKHYLGEGAFAKVYKVKEKSTNKYFAAKIFDAKIKWVDEKNEKPPDTV